MRNTHSFKMNLPEMSDPVDVRELNDNFLVIDDALMAGLCKKELTTNNMGSSDPASRKYGWAPWIEIYNGNEFDVVVIDRNAPDLPSGTINIEAGKTHRMFINGTYYMNFYVQDQHEVTFKWFTNAETRINEIEPSGGGGVSSVNVTGASGSHIESSGGPVTDSGTIELSISEGYSIPQTNKQTAWDGKAADLKFEINSSTYVITAQLKDSSGNLIGNERTIDLPLESVVVSGTYDGQTKKVILTLQNGSTIEFSVADLVSGLQTELSASNTLDPDYIDYDASHRAVSDTEKNTWNSKQNAISDLETIRSGAAAGATAVQPGTMSTALALKQDSLDNTQLAAVNSGIDSNKVGQISTNQTNIWYALEVGAKNLFRWDKWVNDCNVVGGTKTISSGVMTLTSSSTNCYTEYEDSSYPDVEIPVKANEQYVMTWENWRISGSSHGTVYVVFVGSTGAATASASAEVKKIEFTTPTGTTGLRVYIKQTTDALIENYSDFMICSKTIWDTLGHNYQPPSVSNYDLTRLESEDRAALAEQVDCGAKNEFEFGEFTTGGQAGTTVTTSDNSITVTGASGWAKAWRTFRVKKNTTYVLSFRVTNVATVTNPNYRVSLGNNHHSGGSYYGIIRCNTTGNYYMEFTPPTDADIFLVINPNYAPSAVSDTPSMTVDNIMVCTEADWKISQNYAPFALPNTDLTRLESEDRAALAEEIDAGAKNKCNWAAATVYTQQSCSYTKTDSDLTIASTMTDGWGHVAYSIGTLPAGNYTLSVKISSYSADSATCKVGVGITAGALASISGNGTVTFNFTKSSASDTKIYFYANFSASAIVNSYVASEIMVCTKAAFDVSQKLVPYRPNWDLVSTLFPTSYTAPVVNSDISSKLSILSGGYAKAGNLVTVNIRLSVTDTISAGSALFTGLPEPKATAALSYGSAVVPVTNMCVNAQVSPNVMSIDTRGAIRLAETPVSSDITTGIYILSATYLSA